MRAWIAPVVVATTALALHARTLGFGLLLYDDPHFMPALAHERSLANLVEVFARPTYGAWHPLHQLSYALDSILLGDRALAYHAGNVVWYALLAAVVVMLARALGRSEPAAWAAGLAFAVHPAHGENVAWVSARKDLVAGALGVAALAVYLRPDGGAPSRRRVALALGLFALALLAKSIAAPLALVLLGRALVERRGRDELFRIAPFLATGAIALAIHASCQHAIGAALGPMGGSWLLQWRIALHGFVESARMVVLPVGISTRPQAPLLESAPGLDDVPGVLLALAVVVALAIGARRNARWLLPLALGVVTLLPTAGLVPLPAYVQARYLLLPTVGLTILAGDAWEAVRRRSPGLAWSTGPLLLLALVPPALQFADAFRSDQALWSRALALDPENVEALESLADLELSGGRADVAEALARRALARRPVRFAANMVLARLALSRGDVVEARARLVAAGSSGANDRAQAWALLAHLEVGAGDLDAAEQAVARGRGFFANEAEIEAAAGRVYLARARYEDALASYERAIARERLARATGELGRAIALRGLGRRDEARAALARARESGAAPSDVAALEAHLALDEGRVAEAGRLLEGKTPTLAWIVARARVAAAQGEGEVARGLLARVATSAPGVRREALREPELARITSETR